MANMPCQKCLVIIDTSEFASHMRQHREDVE